MTMSVDTVVHNMPFPSEPVVELSATMGYLRENEPLARVRLRTGEMAWLVTRYEDVCFVLSDRRFSVAGATSSKPVDLSPLTAAFPDLLSMEDPLHRPARRVLSRALHALPEPSLGETFAGQLDDLLDMMIEKGSPADLMADYIKPGVKRFAAAWLGITADEIDQLLAMMLMSAEESATRVEEFKACLLGIFRAKRANPTDDLFSHIVAEYDADGSLSDENLIGIGLAAFAGAAHTPLSHLTYAIVTILRYPDQWALLCAQPELLESAVHECVRYGGHHEVDHLRITTEEVELVGVTLPVGSAVVTSIGAANRDLARFDDAGRFDITRDRTRHIGFGHGRHACIGNHIGTLMLRAALGGLSQRIPGMRLAVSDDEIVLANLNKHAKALLSLPVRW
jgi:cytochrome P450